MAQAKRSDDKSTEEEFVDPTIHIEEWPEAYDPAPTVGDEEAAPKSAPAKSD